MTGAEKRLSELSRQLVALLRAEWDAEATIEGLVQLTGGASFETWSFLAVRGDGTRSALIARRAPPELEVQPYGIAKEAAAFRAAAEAGVPEPRVLCHGEDRTILGSPFILMEHVEGETLARRLLRDPQYETARGVLAHQCGEILARIHSIGREEIPHLEESDPLAAIEESLAGFEEPLPVFELALRWLYANRPVGARTSCVVHGDFRNGNLIVGSDGIRAVLDWELVHWGDPAEDLGWLCVKAWRFGAAPPVGGFGSYEQLLDGYAAGGGAPTDQQTLRWWEALGTLRWGLMCVDMARRHLEGSIRSVELAAIGRRSCEQEWDLLKLIR